MRRTAMGHPHRPQTADQHGHFRRGQAQQLRPVDQHLFGRHRIGLFLEVAEAFGLRLHLGKDVDVGLVLRGIGAAGGEGNLNGMARRFRCRLDRHHAAQHDQIGQ